MDSPAEVETGFQSIGLSGLSGAEPKLALNSLGTCQAIAGEEGEDPALEAHPMWPT